MHIELLYQKYKQQTEKMNDVACMDANSFTRYLEDKLNKFSCIETDEGFIYYDSWTKEDLCVCFVPVYGYYANSEKTMVKLFQEIADQFSSNTSCKFLINLYSDDVECINALHMMQFGNISETGIKRIEKSFKRTDDRFDTKVLNKHELTMYWEEVWQALDSIINHLKQSPVFYPGKEFTEEIYKTFFFDDNTEVIAAFDNEKIIGIIEWNKENNKLMCGDNSANVGEIYVYPEYRKTGLADELLEYAMKRADKEGFNYLWVEHGTANPNARGFWNKFFETYQYELIRVIDFEENDDEQV